LGTETRKTLHVNVHSDSPVGSPATVVSQRHDSDPNRRVHALPATPYDDSEQHESFSDSPDGQGGISEGNCGAGGGDRTRTAFRPQDFKTENADPPNVCQDRHLPVFRQNLAPFAVA
jgi:hypothetical protein